MLRTNFKREWSALVQVEPLLWASFVPTLYPDGDTTRKPLNDIYCELTNREAVKKKCEAYLEEFNNLYSGNRMNLVLFMVAIEHIVKIVRVLTTTFGHALLVGVGGSGRKSLAMLSSYIAYMTEYNEVNSKNWV
jgi:dynein heavy chain